MRRTQIPSTIALVLCGIIVLSGCRHSAPATTGTPGASPANAKDRMLAEQWDEATHGLRFDTASGLVEVERVAAGNPQTAAEHLAAADTLLAQNRIVEATEQYGLAARHDPELADAFVGLGRLLTRKGLHGQAIAAFRTALDRDAGHLDARYRLALALWSASRPYEAIDEMNRVVTEDDAHARAHERLAVWYYYTDDFASAWHHLHRAEELGQQVPGQLPALLSQRMVDPDSPGE